MHISVFKLLEEVQKCQQVVRKVPEGQPPYLEAIIPARGFSGVRGAEISDTLRINVRLELF